MIHQITYPSGLEEYDYWDIEQKGWLDGVKVIWADKEIVLSIFSEERLAQVVRDDTARLGFFALKALLVVHSVNRNEIDAAIQRMAEREFVDLL